MRVAAGQPGAQRELTTDAGGVAHGEGQGRNTHAGKVGLLFVNKKKQKNFSFVLEPPQSPRLRCCKANEIFLVLFFKKNALLNV
jgi:hypothetical protein